MIFSLFLILMLVEDVHLITYSPLFFGCEGGTLIDYFSTNPQLLDEICTKDDEYISASTSLNRNNNNSSGIDEEKNDENAYMNSIHTTSFQPLYQFSDSF